MRDVFGSFFTVLAVGFGALALYYTSLSYLVLATVFLGIGFIIFDMEYNND